MNMERKHAAILSADVQGYSRLMGKDEVGTVRTLMAYRETMTMFIQQHRGRVVDAPGDNLLAEFASVVSAIQCAVEIQRELKTQNAELRKSRRLEFRIGINLGEIIVHKERIYVEARALQGNEAQVAGAGWAADVAPVRLEHQKKVDR